MTAHVEELAALEASLPPGAVLAHVVTPSLFRVQGLVPDDAAGNTVKIQAALDAAEKAPCWAKIGDEPWRSVSDLRVCQAEGWDQPDGSALLVTWRAWLNDWALFPIVTPSVTWEQRQTEYGFGGMVGWHAVMGVIG